MLPLLFAAAAGLAAQPPAIVPGEGFQVERYAVTIRPDLATRALSGMQTIVVQSTSDGLTRLSFTPNALRITGATADGEGIVVSPSDKAIVFALSRPLEKGRKATLRFRVDGTPARGVTTVPEGIYTSYFACDWMVCLQDVRGDKAHFSLDLFLPAGVTSEYAGLGACVIVANPDFSILDPTGTRP